MLLCVWLKDNRTVTRERFVSFETPDKMYSFVKKHKNISRLWIDLGNGRELVTKDRQQFLDEFKDLMGV